jgi:hypothetical protein
MKFHVSLSHWYLTHSVNEIMRDQFNSAVTETACNPCEISPTDGVICQRTENNCKLQASPLYGGMSHDNFTLKWYAYEQRQYWHTSQATSVTYGGVSKSFRTESITKYNHWEATQRDMAAKLTELTHKIAIQLHLVAERCTICRSRRPVRKLLHTP